MVMAMKVKSKGLTGAFNVLIWDMRITFEPATF